MTVAALAMKEGLQYELFNAAQRSRLSSLVDINFDDVITDYSKQSDERLAGIDIVITGWGGPCIDEAARQRLSSLRAVIHTAGTVKNIIAENVISAGDLLVTTAAQANAVPVAEFSLAHILLAGKRSIVREADHRAVRGRRKGWLENSDAGNYGAVIGLIGASRIGSLVAEYLRPFDVDVLIADPIVAPASVAALGARVATLEEVFALSDVVSLHAPDVPSTRGMVSAELLASMRDGTTFINTARPALVDEEALRRELISGRISAVLDVNDTLAEDDPLWDAPNVSITPHLAGSQGNELHRMAESALDEVRRFVTGQPARYPVDPASLAFTA